MAKPIALAADHGGVTHGLDDARFGTFHRLDQLGELAVDRHGGIIQGCLNGHFNLGLHENNFISVDICAHGRGLAVGADRKHRTLVDRIVPGFPAAEADALGFVAGLVIVADLSVPHDSFYRPSVRLKARDGFCPLGPAVAPVADPDALSLRVFVEGTLVHEASTGDRIRGAARLIADVSDFMTLSPGDVLMLGVAHGAPLLPAGQRAWI